MRKLAKKPMSVLRQMIEADAAGRPECAAITSNRRTVWIDGKRISHMTLSTLIVHSTVTRVNQEGELDRYVVNDVGRKLAAGSITIEDIQAMELHERNWFDGVKLGQSAA